MLCWPSAKSLNFLLEYQTFILGCFQFLLLAFHIIFVFLIGVYPERYRNGRMTAGLALAEEEVLSEKIHSMQLCAAALIFLSDAMLWLQRCVLGRTVTHISHWGVWAAPREARWDGGGASHGTGASDGRGGTKLGLC